MLTRQEESAVIDNILEDAFATYCGNLNSGHHLLPIIESYDGRGLPQFVIHRTTQTPSSSECSDEDYGFPVQEDDAPKVPTYIDGWEPRISYEENWIEDNSAWPWEDDAARLSSNNDCLEPRIIQYDAWTEDDSAFEDDCGWLEIVQQTHSVKDEWW